MHRKARIHFKGTWFHFLHVAYTKDKQMPVFRFMFDLLWRGKGSLVTSVVPWAKQIQKHGTIQWAHVNRPPSLGNSWNVVKHSGDTERNTVHLYRRKCALSVPYSSYYCLGTNICAPAAAWMNSTDDHPQLQEIPQNAHTFVKSSIHNGGNHPICCTKSKATTMESRKLTPVVTRAGFPSLPNRRKKRELIKYVICLNDAANMEHRRLEELQGDAAEVWLTATNAAI